MFNKIIFCVSSLLVWLPCIGQSRFLADTSRNKIATDQIELSSIFKWYRGDFTKKGNLVDYINKYSEVLINSNARVSFLEYDWSLNE